MKNSCQLSHIWALSELYSYKQECSWKGVGCFQNRKTFDVIILSFFLLIPIVTLAINRFRKTCSHTSHFVILCFIFLHLNIKFGSFLNCLGWYRIRDYIAGFPDFNVSQICSPMETTFVVFLRLLSLIGLKLQLHLPQRKAQHSYF